MSGTKPWREWTVWTTGANGWLVWAGEASPGGRVLRGVIGATSGQTPPFNQINVTTGPAATITRNPQRREPLRLEAVGPAVIERLNPPNPETRFEVEVARLESGRYPSHDAVLAAVAEEVAAREAGEWLRQQRPVGWALGDLKVETVWPGESSIRYLVERR